MALRVCSDHTPERRALAEAAVHAAFRLRPDAAEAHVARAPYLYSGCATMAAPWPNSRSRAEHFRMIRAFFELTAAIMRRQGKHDEGLRNYERAVEVGSAQLLHASAARA